MIRRVRMAVVFALALLQRRDLPAQSRDSARVQVDCADSSSWNDPQPPFRVFGNTWYVGTHCLSAILITSEHGHVLIDGTTMAAGPQILHNVMSLGFQPSDIRLILNSHAHHDHAGGLAYLQHSTGAVVAASQWSARVLEAGGSTPGDPQFGALPGFPPVAVPLVIRGGDVLSLGSVALVAHRTGGHTPGGTSWSWRSCEDARCLDVVYADSQTPVSAPGFSFTKSDSYPNALRDFAEAQALLERVPCDILLTPHPTASRLWDRLERHTFTDGGACKLLATTARAAVARRVVTETDARR